MGERGWRLAEHSPVLKSYESDYILSLGLLISRRPVPA
jgi:hypothetical protein